LVSYITGKDVRVGLPNEHLGKDSHGKVTSPMYSTGVGLVLKGFEDLEVQLVGPDEAGNKQKPKVGGILVRLKELLAEFFEEDVT
jgi:cell division protein FtsA